MNQRIEFSLADVVPAREAVLQYQGISKDDTVGENIKQILAAAMEWFHSEAIPVAKVKEISQEQCADLYIGQGENPQETPFQKVFSQAEHLALFGITMGAALSSRVEDLFEENDFATGYMLDSVASSAVEKAVEVLGNRYLAYLLKEHPQSSHLRVLSYSPGYCGWHISAQKKMFTYLKPETIGISLNESCLMSPLKSATGVLAAGDKKIHFIEAKYAFCDPCKTHSCRDRMRKVSRKRVTPR